MRIVLRAALEGRVAAHAGGGVPDALMLQAGARWRRTYYNTTMDRSLRASACVYVCSAWVRLVGPGGAAGGAKGTGGHAMAPDHGAAAETDVQRAGSKRPRGL